LRAIQGHSKKNWSGLKKKLKKGEINKLFLGTNKSEGPPALVYRMGKIRDNGRVWECAKTNKRGDIQIFLTYRRQGKDLLALGSSVCHFRDITISMRVD
jgi:hypothetical protein